MSRGNKGNPSDLLSAKELDDLFASLQQNSAPAASGVEDMGLMDSQNWLPDIGDLDVFLNDLPLEMQALQATSMQNLNARDGDAAAEPPRKMQKPIPLFTSAQENRIYQGVSYQKAANAIDEQLKKPEFLEVVCRNGEERGNRFTAEEFSFIARGCGIHAGKIVGGLRDIIERKPPFQKMLKSDSNPDGYFSVKAMAMFLRYTVSSFDKRMESLQKFGDFVEKVAAIDGKARENLLEIFNTQIEHSEFFQVQSRHGNYNNFIVSVIDGFLNGYQQNSAIMQLGFNAKKPFLNNRENIAASAPAPSVASLAAPTRLAGMANQNTLE